MSSEGSLYLCLLANSSSRHFSWTLAFHLYVSFGIHVRLLMHPYLGLNASKPIAVGHKDGVTFGRSQIQAMSGTRRKREGKYSRHSTSW